ncbi:MAG TPA: DUF2779 domain-containing protein [Gemmatimonadales bacterium]|nr:DUF2779 domain-containing protein [Gemmatimonadales bacterium]
MTVRPRLTKTHFQSGLACPKRLWWEVHEPDAPELVPDAQTRWMLRQGQEVTVAARSRVPTASYEQPLETDRLYARVDLLEPRAGGTHNLIEVKGSNEPKEEHLWDIAFQRHVAAEAGVEIHAAQLMYLNRTCQHPDLGSLFIRDDVSDRIAPMVSQVPGLAKQLLAVLDGPLPGDVRNANCGGCPFYDRCWPQDRFAVNRLYRMRWDRKLDLERSGVSRIADVPDTVKLNAIQRRQRAAAVQEALVVEDTLTGALGEWVPPLVYLDFETVAFAIPRFAGMTPWARVPAQFSAHRQEGAGHTHHAFLADGNGDPRRPLAEALIAACQGPGSVVTFHSAFEKGCLRDLAAAMPDLDAALMDIHARVVDLEPMLTHHLYHPDFRGSFSLKVVLPTLCPETSYAGLTIADGGAAQLALARLIDPDGSLSPTERGSLRADLLAYCERDTWAMVVVHRRLRELAGIPAEG